MPIYLFMASTKHAIIRRGIIVYIEHQGVCPIDKIGPPTPFPASEWGDQVI